MAPNDLLMNPHLRLSWGGDIGVPAVEQWANSIRLVDFTDGNFPTPDQLQIACNAAAVPIQTWFTSVAMLISSSVRLAWCKLNILDEYGHQPPYTIRHDFPAGVFGPSNAPCDWNQTYAITFRTKLARGRAHAGRIFPPVVTANPEGKTPYISAGDSSNLAAVTGMLLNDITKEVNTAIAANQNPNFPNASTYVPAVVSPGIRSKGTAEVRQQILSVVVDRVPDVQHRRTAQVSRNEGQPYPIPFN